MTCNPVALPAAEADFCAPEIDWGQVEYLYLGNDGEAAFSDWTTVTEWNTRLDNADVADSSKIRTLHVIGDKPATEKNKIDFSLGRSVYTDPKHTLNARTEEVGDLNYALVQFYEENQGQTVRIWWSDGKYLYGGNEGVQANITMEYIVPESKEELKYIQVTVTWEGLSPARTVNPIA